MAILPKTESVVRPLERKSSPTSYLYDGQYLNLQPLLEPPITLSTTHLPIPQKPPKTKQRLTLTLSVRSLVV